MKSVEKNVLTYGSFDMFHSGHVQLLQKLASLGDRLIVGCATDEFLGLSGQTSVMPYEKRREILEACRYVDRVIPQRHHDQKRTDIVNCNIWLFAIGEDWSGAFDDLTDLTQVLYLPRTPAGSLSTLPPHVSGGTLAKSA